MNNILTDIFNAWQGVKGGNRFIKFTYFDDAVEILIGHMFVMRKYAYNPYVGDATFKEIYKGDLQACLTYIQSLKGEENG